VKAADVLSHTAPLSVQERTTTMFATKNAKAPSTTTLTIEGMSCGSCVNHVSQALEGLPGVASVEVNLRQGSATVRHDATVDSTAMIKAVESVGYEAKTE